MATSTMQFKIYRYDPDKDNAPYMQDISVEVDFASTASCSTSSPG
jgi:succinate dehydrogenase / fumarate reductase iron-sulfur subunit